MTSRFLDSIFLSSKQTLRCRCVWRHINHDLIFNLFFAIFEDEKKSIAKGENHVKSDHIECFMYNQGILRGKVHASMRSKVYEVTVRKLSCMFMFIFCESVGNH